jgi:hypothetical protein
MQQGRNAAESAFIRPKQAAARKPALTAPAGRFRPIENRVPSAI